MSLLEAEIAPASPLAPWRPRPTSSTAYLVGSGLVLLGGYLELYGGGVPTTVASAIGSVVFYETVLLVAAVYLFRVRGKVGETLTLSAILLAFLLDLPMVQQRFGWEEGPGRLAGLLGFASGLAIAGVLAVALRLPLTGRMFGTLAASIAFGRLAPAVLAGETETGGLAPGFVLLGWLLAGTLLPAALLPGVGARRAALPLARMEEAVVGAGLCAALLHFLLAGISLSLGFRLIYLAPYLVLLSPALERLVPASRRNEGHRLVLLSLPYLGLAVSALELTRERPVGAEGTWTLTPFSLTLYLTIALAGARALRAARPGPWHAAAALACLAVLARNLDLPEALARLRYPEAWQVAAVSALAWGTVLAWRDFRSGLPLLLVSALPLASLLEGPGVPLPAAAALVVAWTVVLLRAVTKTPASRLLSTVPALVLSILPPALLLLEPGVEHVRWLFAVQLTLAFVAGRWFADRVLRLGSVAALLGAGALATVRTLEVAPMPAGTLLVRLGLGLFLLGILGSLFGRRLREKLRRYAAPARLRQT